MSPKDLRPEIKQFGFFVAWNRFVERRHLRTLAYLLLAAACAFSIRTSEKTSHQNDRKLAQQTKIVLVQNCYRGNSLRGVLRGILEQSKSDTVTSLRRHFITPEQAAFETARLEIDIQKLNNIDCTQVNSTVK